MKPNQSNALLYLGAAVMFAAAWVLPAWVIFAIPVAGFLFLAWREWKRA